MPHSDDRISYQSTEWVDSRVMAGVRFEIRRVSLSRRAEITERVRGLLAELEYRDGGEGLEDRLSAGLVRARIDRVYLEWGLVRLAGLLVDGEPATVESLIERGPEALSCEIADAVRGMCHLSEQERKN